MKKCGSECKGLPAIHNRAVGIDIGSRFHVVAVPADLAEDPVQTFNTFNAGDVLAVPGRKTDANDAQWIQRFDSCGLLRASFHPDREISALRSYLRLRERHLDYASAHIQHMQKP